MKSASIFLYCDRWFIHANSKTTVGAWLAQPPYVKLAAEVDSGTLGQNVLSALAHSELNIPHPKTWDKDDPLIALAGAKSWRAFAKSATYFDVSLDAHSITITPWQYRPNDAAFVECSEPPTEIASDSSPNQIGTAVKEAFRWRLNHK